MEYCLEDISSVKKKVAVVIPQKEVNDAINATVNEIINLAQIPGFRKGKAPARIVESHYHEKIYSDAKEKAMDKSVAEIFGKLNVTPVGGIKFEGADEPLKKNEPYSFQMEFEIIPEFPLPEYNGLEVEEKKTEIDDKLFESLVERFRREHSKVVAASGDAPPKDGESANIDFQVFDDGKLLKDLDVKAYNLELGNHEAFEDFEKLVKSVPVGHTGEGEISFPKDYLEKDLAGKTVLVKVTVHSVKKRILPELNEDFAKKLGKNSVDEILEMLKNGYLYTVGQINKGEAQQKIIDTLLKQTEIELPESLIGIETRFLLMDIASDLERQGRSLGSLGKSLQELITEIRPQAEKKARMQALLHAIAKKENLTITEKEVLQQLMDNSIKTGRDFTQVREEMENAGLLQQLSERMLADKAMDLIYERANKKFIEADKKLDDSSQESVAAPQSLTDEKKENPES